MGNNKKNQVKKNSNEQQTENKQAKTQRENFEMDLQAGQTNEQSNDSQPSEPTAISDLDRLIEEFPSLGADKLAQTLKEMSYDDAVEMLREDEKASEEEEDEPINTPDPKPEVNNNPVTEEKPMTEETVNTENEMSAEEKFELLMAEQNKMQKALEKKKGGVVTVDDTMERAERATKIASEGKRKGKQFKPNKGTAMFMAIQNAKYKTSGKPAPYSEECMKNTFMREEGLLKGKA